MTVEKWNEQKRVYEPVEIPNDWKIKTYCADMDEVVNCVCCGKEMKFGDGYTSGRFLTEHGFGYTECEECYFDD